MSRKLIFIIVISLLSFYSCKKCKNCKTVLSNIETGAVLSETESTQYCDEDLQDIEKEKPVINGKEKTETVCE